jgi:hypothetical protein
MVYMTINLIINVSEHQHDVRDTCVTFILAHAVSLGTFEEAGG